MLDLQKKKAMQNPRSCDMARVAILVRREMAGSKRETRKGDERTVKQLLLHLELAVYS